MDYNIVRVEMEIKGGIHEFCIQKSMAFMILKNL
jgi:hypothetical protein